MKVLVVRTTAFITNTKLVLLHKQKSRPAGTAQRHAEMEIALHSKHTLPCNLSIFLPTAVNLRSFFSNLNCRGWFVFCGIWTFSFCWGGHFVGFGTRGAYKGARLTPNCFDTHIFRDTEAAHHWCPALLYRLPHKGTVRVLKQQIENTSRQSQGSPGELRLFKFDFFSKTEKQARKSFCHFRFWIQQHYSLAASSDKTGWFFSFSFPQGSPCIFWRRFAVRFAAGTARPLEKRRVGESEWFIWCVTTESSAPVLNAQDLFAHWLENKRKGGASVFIPRDARLLLVSHQNKKLSHNIQVQSGSFSVVIYFQPCSCRRW